MQNNGDPFEPNKATLRASEAPWATAPDRDLRGMGNKIIATPESTHVPEADSATTPEVPLELPDLPLDENNLPIIPDTPQTTVDPAPTMAPYEKAIIKTTAKLDKRAVKAIDAAIHNLNKNGDVADFYDTARNMMEDNLGNSFERKIGAAS